MSKKPPDKHSTSSLKLVICPNCSTEYEMPLSRSAKQSSHLISCVVCQHEWEQLEDTLVSTGVETQGDQHQDVLTPPSSFEEEDTLFQGNEGDNSLWPPNAHLNLNLQDLEEVGLGLVDRERNLSEERRSALEERSTPLEISQRSQSGLRKNESRTHSLNSSSYLAFAEPPRQNSPESKFENVRKYLIKGPSLTFFSFLKGVLALIAFIVISITLGYGLTYVLPRAPQGYSIHDSQGLSSLLLTNFEVEHLDSVQSPQFRISAQLENPMKQAIKVEGFLFVQLIDPSGEVIGEYPIPFSQPVLGGQSKMPFQVDLESLPVGVLFDASVVIKG